jgi:septin 4
LRNYFIYLFLFVKDAVGFSTLPDQLHRKNLKRGFEFTLLVVGDSGLGKSTLVNSLFMTDLYSDRKIDDVKGIYTNKKY